MLQPCEVKGRGAGRPEHPHSLPLTGSSDTRPSPGGPRDRGNRTQSILFSLFSRSLKTSVFSFAFF